jgi:hypothetical protein
MDSTAGEKISTTAKRHQASMFLELSTLELTIEKGI